jgi:hypothetical protein
MKSGRKIDRLLEGPTGERMAIVLLTSSDARAEAEDARGLTSLLKELTSEPSRPELLVIAVGYSSERVHTLVGEISRVLKFDENNFQEIVERELRRLSAPAPRSAGQEAPDLAPLLKQLTTLDGRLARIEERRAEDQRETVESLERGTLELAESERIKVEAKTRHELRFGLDELHMALTQGSQEEERRILRRLLVANEANVKDPTFDYLASVYLDALDSVELSYSNRDVNSDIVGNTLCFGRT